MTSSNLKKTVKASPSASNKGGKSSESTARVLKELKRPPTAHYSPTKFRRTSKGSCRGLNAFHVVTAMPGQRVLKNSSDLTNHPRWSSKYFDKDAYQRIFDLRMKHKS